MAGGDTINRPKKAVYKSLHKLGRVRKQQRKKSRGQQTSKRVVDSLTPSHVRKKTRTNPIANITLSGKKKRLILKQIKKQKTEAAQMEVVTTATQVTKEKKEAPTSKQQQESSTTTTTKEKVEGMDVE